MEDILAVEKSPDDMPAIITCKPHAGLAFLAPEPEDVEDLYSRYKKLQQELEFLEVQEEYIKDEQKNLKKEFLHAQEEVKRIQSIPLVIGQFLEAVDQNTAIVGSTTGSNYYVRILSTIDRELLKPNASVALHKHSNALVDVLPPEADSSIMMLTSDQKPDVMYADIGGMDIQKQEVREAVELPLTHFELYKQIGIDPPRGVLMYGPPGCGKTMLAKAVAHHTTADREVQRILLELLNQMDGFDQNVNVKVIMATNRADTLDPALLRPGRLDRKIEFPLPDRRQKRLIFSTITSKMNLSEEAGMLAVRENRYIVLAKDFEKAYKTVIKKDEQEHEFYKLDYCNSLLSGCPNNSLRSFQLIQNAAARVLTGIDKRDHITPVMASLHWLPVKFRIIFKILLLTYKVLRSLAPSYLEELVILYQPNRPLRSQNAGLLVVPRVSRSRMGGRAFSYQAPLLWNQLPVQVWEADSIATLKIRLKTYLFEKAYCY
ncbi:26S proteasome regulatory subunit 6B [Takifugu flavidus]|uniref:26S proteasome regulatory subunit 6B n=1 Tax=Takifugu flavidus TaxID=433684 RepID=A0A5C6PN48_9TELE|nr:26S proteasome regulatory subunit 6B [Takifugu flavidus]